MNKKLLFILLPICLSSLPACTREYTLTIVNSNPEAGEISGVEGKYKFGESVPIKVNLTQGYKIEKWEDSVSGGVGTKDDFVFSMPQRDTTLTVYYDYADFTLSGKETISTPNGQYDFSSRKQYSPFYFTTYSVNGNWASALTSNQITWKDEVNITDIACNSSYSEYITYEGVYDEYNNKLADTSCSFAMPNYDVALNFHYTSHCYCVCLTASELNLSSSNFTVTDSKSATYYSGDRKAINEFYVKDTIDTVTVTYNNTSSDATFQYWIDLDANKVFSYDLSFTIENLSGNHHYCAQLTKNNA